jgi:hypothetical protein
LLLKILSTAVTPEILQSDNSGEFTEQCINYVKECLPQVHIVKGRPRCLQSQGCVEQGNATFNDALNSWMADNSKGMGS